MITSRFVGALLLPGALAIAAAGCAQGSGEGRGADRDDRGAVTASARRGGDSPAESRTGRADGGADRRESGGQFQYTLAYPTGERETSLLLLEVAVPQRASVGRPYNYAVRVTNLTDTPLHGVAVREAGAAAAAAVSGPDAARAHANAASAARPGARGGATTRPGAEDGERIAWDVGTLGPKQTRTQEFTATADQVGTLQTCLAVSYEPTLCVALEVTQPELEIVKAGPSDVLICQEIPYTYTVRNAGSGPAENVVLEDKLPDGLQTAEGRNVVTANIGTLKQGESKNVTARLRAQRTGRFASRAVARMAGNVTQSRAVTTVVREPVLAVEVEAPEATYVGQALNFRVTVRNTGDAPAEKTVLRLSGVGGTERLADRDLGTIAPGAAQAVNVSTRAGSDARASLTATAEAVCARPAVDEAAVEIRTVPALQLEVVDGEDPVQVGADTTYTINVRNEGSGPDRDVVLRGTLPAEMQFVSGKGATRVTAQGREVTFAPVAELPPGAVATWTIVVRARASADARFGLELNSAALGRPAVETEPTRIFDPKNPGAEPPTDAERPAGAPGQVRRGGPAPKPRLNERQIDAEPARAGTPDPADEADSPPQPPDDR
jgi:uncharacterized repeat protein (TIGR01451 family)